MRSKWYRSVVAVALVAAFAAGTVVVSGGYQPFELGEVGGNPLRGVDIAHASDIEPQGFAIMTGTVVAAMVAAAVGRAISPFRRSGSMPVGLLDESIFDR